MAHDDTTSTTVETHDVSSTRSISPVHSHKSEGVVKLKALCRRVAPYIVHRWKDVCDELGVLTRDIVYVQARHLSGATLSDLAFQGLCCWLEKGHNHNKQHLLNAVQVCGLKRAEEEVNEAVKLTLPTGFGAETAKKSKLAKISRQQAFLNRMATPKPNSSRPKYLLHGRKKPKPKKRPIGEICELRIMVSVSRVLPGEKTQTSKTSTNTAQNDLFDRSDDLYKNSCQSFCRRAMADIRRKTEHVQDVLDIPGFTIQRMLRVGSAIYLHVLFSSLGGIELFYQMWRSGRLKSVIKAAIIKDTYLDQEGGTIDLGLQVDEGLINKFREVLLARVREQEAPKMHPTDILPSLKKTEGPPENVDKEFSVKAWRRELDWQIDRIESRHNSFQPHYSDMLMALRIAKPATLISGITTLGDVIECHTHMRGSGGTVSKNIRIDLVREYISNINKIRLVVENIRANEVKISMDQSISPSTCEVFHHVLQRLEVMLKPSHEFKIDRNKSSMYGYKEESFTGLVSYIPDLISKLIVMNSRLAET